MSLRKLFISSKNKKKLNVKSKVYLLLTVRICSSMFNYIFPSQRKPNDSINLILLSA